MTNRSVGWESNSHNEGVECDEEWWRGKTLPGLRLAGRHAGRDAGGGGKAEGPPVTREQGPSRSGTDKHHVQQRSQTQRASFTTVVSTFRLPKIPFTDWLPLIKRMSPVLLARCRARPAMWGSVWTLCRGGFPMGWLLSAHALLCPASTGQVRQRCFPQMPLHGTGTEERKKTSSPSCFGFSSSLQTQRTPSSSLLLHLSVQRFS